MGRSVRVLVLVGAVFYLLGLAAWLVLPPSLVKYGNVDRATHGKGTFTLLLAPGDFAPTNRSFPLDVARHVHTPSVEGSKAVIDDDTVQKIGPLPPRTVRQQYVIDRSSLQAVASGQSWAYSPATVVDRAPNYTINFPFDTGAGPYPLWRNDIGAPASFDRQGEATTDGLKVLDFRASVTGAAAQPYYIAQVSSVVKELTLTQLRLVLAARGLDVAVLIGPLCGLGPVDRAALTTLARQPVPLAYTVDAETRLQVEPRTGGIVNLKQIRQALQMRPDLGRFEAILAHYPADPALRALTGRLRALREGPPIPVFRFEYAQTAASVQDTVNYVADAGKKFDTVTFVLPVLLLTGGVICWVAAPLVVLFSRWGPSAGPPGHGAAAVDVEATSLEARLPRVEHERAPFDT